MPYKKCATVAFDVTAVLGGEPVTEQEIKHVLGLTKDRVINPDTDWIARQVKAYRADPDNFVPANAVGLRLVEDDTSSDDPPADGASALPAEAPAGTTAVTSKAARPALKRPPRRPSASEPDEGEGGIDPAAAELVQYLEDPRLFWPDDKPFPSDTVEFSEYEPELGRNITRLRATTVDGVKVTLSRSEALENLRRRNNFAYTHPLFSAKEERAIVKLVAALRTAPKKDSAGPYGEKLFTGHTDWFYHLLQNAILIWAKECNPPGLDLEQFPHRKGIREVTFRYRAVDIGFVTRLVDSFDAEAITSGLTGGKLRDFENDWISEFAAGTRTVTMGSDEKTIRDFTVSRKQGTEEQLRKMWEMVRSEAAMATRARRSGNRVRR